MKSSLRFFLVFAAIAASNLFLFLLLSFRHQFIHELIQLNLSRDMFTWSIRFDSLENAKIRIENAKIDTSNAKMSNNDYHLRLLIRLFLSWIDHLDPYRNFLLTPKTTDIDHLLLEGVVWKRNAAKNHLPFYAMFYSLYEGISEKSSASKIADLFAYECQRLDRQTEAVLPHL
jgi:hypothetical protein